MNIILIAPPAAGKGTQSELMVERDGLSHISTGDLLREVAKENTDIGRHIKGLLEVGSLIEDDIVLKLLEEKLINLNSKEGHIFDGFPRTIYQADKLEEVLSKLNQKVDFVFYIDIEKERAMKRMFGRLTCSCGAIYNTYRDTFKKDGYCNLCGEKLSKRTDDNEEAFNYRFDLYVEKTKPLVDYYKNKNLLYSISASDDKEVTYKEIESIIKGKYD